MLTTSTNEDTQYVFIVCKDHAHLIFDLADDLWISGLKFIGCGSNRFTSVKNFMIDNSTFQGQNGSGTALDIADTNLTIVNRSFVSNRLGTCVEIFDVAIKSFWRTVPKWGEQCILMISVMSALSTVPFSTIKPLLMILIYKTAGQTIALINFYVLEVPLQHLILG